MTGDVRDGEEIEALVTDRYLESLLALGDGVPFGLPDADPGHARIPPGVRRAADVLRRDLPRLHPSFRFEERLADRLAGVAAGLRIPAAAGGEGTVIPFGYPGSARSGAGLEEEATALLFDGPLDERPDLRPLLIGGALTSAALSLAGAAWVAWRRSRPAPGPMARAVRAVARARPH